MKMIAGSILASFGLLVTALGYLEANGFAFGRLDTTDYYFNQNTAIEVMAILFISVGIALLIWGIWEARTSSNT